MSATIPGVATVPMSIDEIAAAAGMDDLFLFRKIADGRFAHIGGAGRGAGWAGIVEIGVGEEPLLAKSLALKGVTRYLADDPFHVFGPYYAASVAFVPVNRDVVVVFGSPTDNNSLVTNGELLELAQVADRSVSDVEPAKRLADELEIVNAVRDLLLQPSSTFDEAVQGVVDHATRALSCEIGVVYVRDRGKIAVSDARDMLPAEPEDLRAVLEQIDSRGEFPLCIQDATLDELPAPFSRADGVLAYYLLGLNEPIGGFVLLMHTTAGPRGFTLLCQTLGQRLVEAAHPFLSTGLAREALRSDLERVTGEARRDVLTGLANRLAWDEALADNAMSVGRPMSIVQLDCRGLKRANDTLGHHAGDTMLRRAADIITHAVRANDLVARIGGDEFAILLCDADESVAARIVERIETSVAAEPHGKTADFGLAIGYATTLDGDLVAAQKAADAKMLSAKV
jgi:diguanylate cyclase (GGDEF)-like protein